MRDAAVKVVTKKISTGVVLPLYLGFCFSVFGEMFDKRLFTIARESDYFFEELCKNTATYFLALGAVWTVRAPWEIKEKALS